MQLFRIKNVILFREDIPRPVHEITHKKRGALGSDTENAPLVLPVEDAEAPSNDKLAQ